MKIIAGNEELIFKNILIGDVWVAGGQSNMQFQLKDSLNGKNEILNANNINIRYFEVPRIAWEEQINPINEDQVKWQVCSSENASSSSAEAYHFAKKVTQSINVPIGIIGCNWGGTSASCWISEKYLTEDFETAIYINEYLENIKTVGAEETR